MDMPRRREGDEQRLAALARSEGDARQRDRLRSALLAMEGKEAKQIAAMLGRSRRFVQDWAYAYRDGGVEAERPRPPGHRPARLAAARAEAFKARMLAGPTGADGGVCVLRGEDARRILEREFGVRYSLQGAYDLLHRLNLSCLAPRPRHRKNDPAAMAAWADRAPLLSRG